MVGLPKKLEQKLDKRIANNSLRNLPAETASIDFSSNDYLGFSKHKELGQNALQILSDKRVDLNGATGSRLLTGNSILYSELEQLLCNYYNAGSALVFNSGYDANIGFFSSVPQRNDIVFYDEFVHASIRDGLKLGNANAYRFEHNNLEDLLSVIRRIAHLFTGDDTHVYLVTEAVFSMDGDAPEMNRLCEICDQYNIRLIVDEAHTTGIFGKKENGNLYELVLEKNVFARIITFGKALGCHGAAILGSELLKSYLVNFARSLIYTTALPPHSLASIIAAYDLLQSEKGIQKQHLLRENITYFKELLVDLGLETYFINSYSAIQCCILGGNPVVTDIAEALGSQGMDVRPIKYPTVPEGQERLRFCLHSFNSKQDILAVLKLLKENIINSPSLIKRD